jgi:hypothetical protein
MQECHTRTPEAACGWPLGLVGQLLLGAPGSQLAMAAHAVLRHALSGSAKHYSRSTYVVEGETEGHLLAQTTHPGVSKEGEYDMGHLPTLHFSCKA